MKSLKERMCEYEDITNARLMNRQTFIIRLDGRKFSKFTKGLNKPFDENFYKAMVYTAARLFREIMNVKFIYVQSDEINIAVTNRKTKKKDSWFGNRVEKVVSCSASLATLYFNKFVDSLIVQGLPEWVNKGFTATFDSRAFNIPEDDIVNYFIWRQQDAERNYRMTYARSIFSHKQLMNKNSEEVVKMVEEETGVNILNLPKYKTLGIVLYKDEEGNIEINENIPKFKDDFKYLEQLMEN